MQECLLDVRCQLVEGHDLADTRLGDMLAHILYFAGSKHLIKMDRKGHEPRDTR